MAKERVIDSADLRSTRRDRWLPVCPLNPQSGPDNYRTSARLSEHRMLELCCLSVPRPQIFLQSRCADTPEKIASLRWCFTPPPPSYCPLTPDFLLSHRTVGHFWKDSQSGCHTPALRLVINNVSLSLIPSHHLQSLVVKADAVHTCTSLGAEPKFAGDLMWFCWSYLLYYWHKISGRIGVNIK